MISFTSLLKLSWASQLACFFLFLKERSDVHPVALGGIASIIYLFKGDGPISKHTPLVFTNATSRAEQTRHTALIQSIHSFTRGALEACYMLLHHVVVAPVESDLVWPKSQPTHLIPTPCPFRRQHPMLLVPCPAILPAFKSRPTSKSLGSKLVPCPLSSELVGYISPSRETDCIRCRPLLKPPCP